ncbi:MAG: transglutaminaseTgpA domain-containing protein [Cardiobacterium sp.]
MIRWVSAQAYQDRLDGREWRRITATFTLVALPLFFFLPSALGVLLAAAIALKFVAIARDDERLAIGVAIGLILTGAFLIYGGLRSQGLTLSFVALLVTMSVCKLLESRNRRDVHVLFLLETLLMLAFLMYSQSILIFLYLLFALAVSVHGLVRFEQRGRARVQFARWRDLLRLFLIALPFAAAMFFFFPRIQPLWGMPQQGKGAVTGLPDEMNMGDLSSLAQSNEIAFRVRFDHDQVPQSRNLYWRGPVLWQFDGTQWLQRRGDPFRPPAPVDYQQDSIVRYETTLVKSSLKWLPALDLPQQLPDNLPLGHAYQIALFPAANGVTGKRFRLASALAYHTTGELSRRDRQDALQLPPGLTIPQTQGLAQRLLQENGGTARGFAEGFLKRLHEEEYYYSLEPPPGAGNPEVFLFRDRIGFCEHYASAMVLAARSVGIPARVVIGYQGGELNPLTGDWVVREESAHAWAELWLDGEGWVRFDPTAAVAPDRILQGRLSGNSLSGEDSRAFGTRIAENLGAVAWLRNAIDATQAFWQDWVINLDRDQQQGLLEGLGLQAFGSAGLFIVMALLLAIGSAILYWYWTRRPRHDDDVIARALRRKLAAWEKRGYSKATAESVAVFFRRLAATAGDKQAAQLQQAATLYESLRYREDDNASQLLSLLKRIRL